MSGLETVALIGSFRQRYEDVLNAWHTFRQAGCSITSPLGAPVTDETQDALFVRFTSDPVEWDDPVVQTRALHRILRADVVYVVAPAGYVGRTTCYEIGRVIQAHRPLYFSEHPVDLPVAIPVEFVMNASALAAELRSGGVRFFLDAVDTEHAEWERRLLDGNYLPD